VSDDKKYPYITQFCMNGGHDGVKKLNFRGTLLPSCNFRYDLGYGRPPVICMCDCHADMRAVLDMMKAAGKTMPVAAPVQVERSPETSAIAQSLDAVRKPVFAETQSGRLPPGQLEQYVYDVLQLGIAGIDLTVDYIVMEIMLAHAGYTPSSGAVLNVLRNWDALSYIKLADKPVRIVEKYEALKQVRAKVSLFGSRPRLG
jgi:hypothetical protein